MKQYQRFRLNDRGWLVPDTNGEFVRWADVEEDLKELAARRNEL